LPEFGCRVARLRSFRTFGNPAPGLLRQAAQAGRRFRDHSSGRRFRRPGV